MISGKLDRDSILTSHEVGALIQADPSSVKNWVERGWLKAFKTPGGHRRIRARDLVAFLTQRRMPIPPILAFKRRLMLVDDQRREIEAFLRLLTPYSDRLDVLALDNGIDALIRVGSFLPELIVLDVFMPNIDGLEVLQRLKAHPDTTQIEVIVATGKWSPELEDEALARGARCCVPKPIELELILEALSVEQEISPRL